MEILQLPMVNLRLKIRMITGVITTLSRMKMDNFQQILSDGDYVISKVFDAGGNPIASIDYFFSVQNGEMVVNQKVVRKVND